MGAFDISNWIWSPDWNPQDKDDTRLVYFRRRFHIAAAPKRTNIDITADSRYKLYVNGNFVEAGPSKGDQQIWFYDTVDITDCLKKGENVICVIVLRYPEDKFKGNHGIFRTSLPSLYIKGECRDMEGNIHELSGDENWKCFVDRDFHIIREEELFSPLMIHEEVYGNNERINWMKENFSDESWNHAKPYRKEVDVHGAVSPGNIHPRTIPFMRRRKRRFTGIMDLKRSVYQEEDWLEMLLGNAALCIPPGSEEIVEIDAGEEMTGYLRLAVSGGRGAVAEILQSEAYVQDERIGLEQIPVKKDRLDKENGHLEGYTDIYHVAGSGSEEEQEVYEPFWFRTFRFIRLRVVTGEEPLTIHAFDYEETGYPLDIRTKVQTSDASLAGIWDISERTLKRCMHETYVDCPFYEQLQYAMDARLQILYTYCVSADDRLARKCMDDFRRSQRYDGLMNCCYPNCNPNIIPGFSIYYILMVYDHMMYFGDPELVRYHMPTIEGVLDFFERNLTIEGYVGKIGGVNHEAPFWSFIDWADDWDKTSGMPEAGLKGPITMESLLYIMGLQRAADLAEYIGRIETPGRYRDRAERVQNAIRKYCIGRDGMIQDGPGVDQYSQHCQVFALLTDTVDAKTGRKNLLRTIEDKRSYTQCTVATRYYLFRALERVDLYEYTDRYWETWREMIRNHATTCVEAEYYARSECHAWGSLALYELPSTVLGVRPASPGYATVSIRPALGYLKQAKGDVVTPRGTIKVSWKKTGSGVSLNYEVPDTMKLENRQR